MPTMLILNMMTDDMKVRVKPKIVVQLVARKKVSVQGCKLVGYGL